MTPGALWIITMSGICIVIQSSGVPSLATDALVHGGMDGAILGKHLSVVNSSEVNLSTLLRSYYLGTMEELDHDLSTHLRGRYRRENFKKITNLSLLQEKVADALHSHQQKGDLGVESLMEKGIKDFMLRYMECPAIIPRCMWGAAPPLVPLNPLSPPLPFLYIHHTAIPSKPCRSLQMCSKNMRAMQHFHQKGRGWYDIGYSFVVGSDGYIYEGRGWMSVGAHTKGHNTVGYGVAFIGNYTAHLPAQYDMELVHHHLVKCGVNNGFLQENFTILGHRQVVAGTECPGESLYSEITTWEHYKDTDPFK
ncbi:N-acetylmuramoyl-L-alanine amidase isoform X4 [Sinocyclocheilus anshuiensis]|uniref:N-acetylmuramoyl-L-alanine amidase isoform X4 n=1 Tax=Sinocyclocheilus anshuiensis TaxID=1608454 RepID=UPI0007B99BB7|nr:PREDICTED: N-acetylmuramoyl-L-alanine amidase-like isoform X4 [Sinocyclocheilus anshuiensis]